MKRILVAVACLLPFALAAEAGINRHSPEAAVKAAYVADDSGHSGSRRRGSWATIRCARASSRVRCCARSRLTKIIAGVRDGPPADLRDPFSDSGATPCRAQRRPDLGNSRRREGAGRVRPRRRRAGAIDLRHAVRTRRMAHRRYHLRHARWRKPYPARHARGELAQTIANGPSRNSGARGGPNQGCVIRRKIPF